MLHESHSVRTMCLLLGAKEQIVSFIPLILEGSIRNTRFDLPRTLPQPHYWSDPLRRRSQGRLEEFLLKNGGDNGDDNDPRVQWLLAQERQKITPLLIGSQPTYSAGPLP